MTAPQGTDKTIDIAAGDTYTFTLADFGSIPDLLLRDTKGAVAHVEMGVDRSWPLYLALVALLALEWFLRRRVHVI